MSNKIVVNFHLDIDDIETLQTILNRESCWIQQGLTQETVRRYPAIVKNYEKTLNKISNWKDKLCKSKKKLRSQLGCREETYDNK